MEQVLQVFENVELSVQVRPFLIEGEPWFIGKEVAESLGYKNGNRDITRHVHEEDRKMIDKKTQYQIGIELGQRGGWIINESGLYTLIMKSTLPKAKDFQRWVTSEVLPSIRKTSCYIPGLGQIHDYDQFITKIIEHNQLYAFDDGFKAGYTQAFVELEQECQKIKDAETKPNTK